MEKIPPKNNFGLIVRERIKEYGYKEYEFADFIGINRSTLSRYIKGETLPDYQTAIKICNPLGLNIYEIDNMSLEDLKKDTVSVGVLRNEFERLGIIKAGQDLSEKQLNLLRTLILSNKTMFQNIDKLVTADNLLQ